MAGRALVEPAEDMSQTNCYCFKRCFGGAGKSLFVFGIGFVKRSLDEFHVVGSVK